MAIVLDTPEAGIDYVIYGDKTEVVSNYLQQQLSQLPKMYNEFTERVHNSVNSTLHFLNDKLTHYGIKQRLESQYKGVVENNQYVELNSFQDLQNANLTMQRWVMTHPEIKQHYVNQDIDGYSNTYVNITENSYGENDYNYRRVMDGVLLDVGDRWEFKTYIDELMPGDRELDHFEKDVILNTWSTIDWILDNCKFDFTDVSEEPSKINK